MPFADTYTISKTQDDRVSSGKWAQEVTTGTIWRRYVPYLYSKSFSNADLSPKTLICYIPLVPTRWLPWPVPTPSTGR